MGETTPTKVVLDCKRKLSEQEPMGKPGSIVPSWMLLPFLCEFL